jgi:hypothetical protein
MFLLEDYVWTIAFGAARVRYRSGNSIVEVINSATNSKVEFLEIPVVHVMRSFDISLAARIAEDSIDNICRRLQQPKAKAQARYQLLSAHLNLD